MTEITPDPEHRHDFVLPFAIEGRELRGRFTRLDQTLSGVLDHRDYPESVSFLLAEALTLTALLGTMVKDDGIMTLQVNSDGPVSLLFADYATPGRLRGYARFDEDALAEMEIEDFSRLVPQLLHAGSLSVTLDPEGSKERYQGIVDLEGSNLSECLQTYFRQSEQLPTAIRMAVNRQEAENGRQSWHSGAMMLQPLPAIVDPSGTAESRFGSETAEENWRHGVVMMNSVADAELTDTDTPAEQVLFRLFHEDGVRVWETTDMDFQCRCSAEKVANILRQFPSDELETMKTDEGRVEVGCEICGRRYSFTPHELASE